LNKENEKPLVITIQLLREIKENLSSIKNDKPLVMLAPSGIAGADIKEMLNMDKNQAYDYSFFGSKLMKDLLEVPSLVVSLIDKYLLGGGFELSLTADIRIITKKTRFGFPEVSLGIIPGFGGIELSKLRFGSIALETILLGKIQTHEDFNYYCFDHILENWQLIKSVQEEIIKRTTKISLNALREAKSSFLNKLDFNPERIAKNFSNLFEEYDQKEGMKAFIEKRKPNYYHN
jgi:enoyl-CoA hydratase